MYTYKIEILSVYDGDTLTGMVDLGFNTFQKIKVRLARINTPEIRTKDLKEKARGYEARDYLRKVLEAYQETLVIETVGKGKYGRWIGNLSFEDEDGVIVNVNDLLVEEGLAEYKEY